MLFDFLPGELGVCLTLACALLQPGSLDPVADDGAGFAPAGGGEFRFRQGADFDVQVDTVEQGAGNAGTVAVHLIGGAAALLVVVAEIAARAGIHGRDQLEACGEVRLPCRARNGDVAGFQRFAQDFKHGAGKLRQFIQKQYAVVGQRDFARFGRVAAAH